MADRVVSVALRAEIAQYMAGMTRASLATQGLGTSAESTGRKAKFGYDLAGRASLLMGGAIAGALVGVITKSMQFEKSMSGVSAATGLAGSALDDLRETAMRAGADTQYSATEAADAITEMAKAGVSTADIMGGGLTGALNLAAAGQLDVADAAGIAAVAMTQFKLSGEDLPHVADLLAAGAGKAMGSVDDLGQALNQAGLVASSAGLSIEETTGTLAAFASAGLIGSDAGTSLKTMLQRLQNPSQEAAAQMRALGISMYDANGNFVGMESLAGQLHDGLSNLTPAARDSALAIIFGSDAVRAANVLYAEGADGIAGWTSAVDDAGYAQRQAAALTDNLSGDLERLSGSFDTLLITIGAGLQGPLRGLVQMLGGVLDGVTWLVEKFGELPGPVQAALTLFVAYKALHGPLDSFFTMLSTKITSTATGMGMAVVNAGGLRGALANVAASAGPMAILTVGITALSMGLQSNKKFADESEASYNGWAAALREGGRAAEQARVQMEYANRVLERIDGFSAADSIREGFDRARDSARDYWNALTPLEQAQQKATEWENNLAVAIQDHGRESEEARAAQERYGYWTGLVTERQGALSSATAEATMVMGDYTDALHFIGDTTGMTEEQIKTATDAIGAWRDTLAQVSGAFVEPLAVYQSQIQTMAQATADSTADSTDSWQDYAADTTVSLDEVARQLEEQVTAQQNWRTNIVLLTQRGGLEVGQALAAMGVEGAGFVQQLVDSTDEDFGRMRDLLIADARVGGQGAAGEMDAAMRVMALVGSQGASATVQGIAAQLGIGTDAVRNIAAQYGVALAEGINPILTAVGRPHVTIQSNGINRNTTGFSAFAEGGYTGPGGKHEPAGIVHRGEYVLTKEETARLGIDAIERFANQGYANGGFVTAANVPRPPSTAPYGVPISTAGDGSMQAEYDATTGWLNYLEAVAAVNRAAESAASMIGGGPVGDGKVGGGWGSIWNWIKARVPEARINSTYRPGDPGYHGQNKAVDLGFGSGPGGNGSAGLALINRTLHDGIGGSLAELIYDGLYDDRPDLKNGRPLTYSAATRAEHHNHVHAAVYDQGGILSPGYTLAYNGTGQNERVLTGREWAGATRGGDGIDYGRLAKAIASAERAQVHITTTSDPAAYIRAQEAYERQRAALAPAY